MSTLPILDNLDVGKKSGGTTSKVTADSLPGVLPKSRDETWDPEKYRVRYLKLNMDELGDISELEQIETKALRNKGTFVLTKKEFIFMDKIFILIQYIEEIDRNANKS